MSLFRNTALTTGLLLSATLTTGCVDNLAIQERLYGSWVAQEVNAPAEGAENRANMGKPVSFRNASYIFNGQECQKPDYRRETSSAQCEGDLLSVKCANNTVVPDICLKKDGSFSLLLDETEYLLKKQ